MSSELTALLPHLYGLLPLPAASSALVEVLSESIFKFGKGTKILTEPLLDWFTGSNFQNVLNSEDGGMFFLNVCSSGADVRRPER
jgi:hypothetical protein